MNLLGQEPIPNFVKATALSPKEKKGHHIGVRMPVLNKQWALKIVQESLELHCSFELLRM